MGGEAAIDMVRAPAGADPPPFLQTRMDMAASSSSSSLSQSHSQSQVLLDSIYSLFLSNFLVDNKSNSFLTLPIRFACRRRRTRWRRRSTPPTHPPHPVTPPPSTTSSRSRCGLARMPITTTSSPGSSSAGCSPSPRSHPPLPSSWLLGSHHPMTDSSSFQIPNHVAIKIALELKKLLVDNSLLDVYLHLPLLTIFSFSYYTNNTLHSLLTTFQVLVFLLSIYSVSFWRTIVAVIVLGHSTHPPCHLYNIQCCSSCFLQLCVWIASWVYTNIAWNLAVLRVT